MIHARPPLEVVEEAIVVEVALQQEEQAQKHEGLETLSVYACIYEHLENDQGTREQDDYLRCDEEAAVALFLPHFGHQLSSIALAPAEEHQACYAEQQY